MTPRRPQPLPGLLCALLAVAFVLAAFVHHPAVAAAAGRAAVSVVFPDGSSGTNCLGGADGKAKGVFVRSDCPFCRIAGAIVPRDPADVSVSCAVALADDRPPATNALPSRRALSANAPLRGPPASRS